LSVTVPTGNTNETYVVSVWLNKNSGTSYGWVELTPHTVGTTKYAYLRSLSCNKACFPNPSVLRATLMKLPDLQTETGISPDTLVRIGRGITVVVDRQVSGSSQSMWIWHGRITAVNRENKAMWHIEAEDELWYRCKNILISDADYITLTTVNNTQDPDDPAHGNYVPSMAGAWKYLYDHYVHIASDTNTNLPFPNIVMTGDRISYDTKNGCALGSLVYGSSSSQIFNSPHLIPIRHKTMFALCDELITKQNWRLFNDGAYVSDLTYGTIYYNKTKLQIAGEGTIHDAFTIPSQFASQIKWKTTRDLFATHVKFIYRGATGNFGCAWGHSSTDHNLPFCNDSNHLDYMQTIVNAGAHPGDTVGNVIGTVGNPKICGVQLYALGLHRDVGYEGVIPSCGISITIEHGEAGGAHQTLTGVGKIYPQSLLGGVDNSAGDILIPTAVISFDDTVEIPSSDTYLHIGISALGGNPNPHVYYWLYYAEAVQPDWYPHGCLYIWDSIDGRYETTTNGSPFPAEDGRDLDFRLLLSPGEKVAERYASSDVYDKYGKITKTFKRYAYTSDYYVIQFMNYYLANFSDPNAILEGIAPVKRSAFPIDLTVDYGNNQSVETICANHKIKVYDPINNIGTATTPAVMYLRSVEFRYPECLFYLTFSPYSSDFLTFVMQNIQSDLSTIRQEEGVIL